MNVYPFVEAEQAGLAQRRQGVLLCSRSPATALLPARLPEHVAVEPAARADEVLRAADRAHRDHDSRGTYGAPRVLAQLLPRTASASAHGDVATPNAPVTGTSSETLP